VLSHAYYESGALIDVAPIVTRAHELGALVVLDSYQTTGTVPFDVVALDVDIVVGGSHKWLCGGPGCGYIYVKSGLHERFSPLVTGWWAHRDPFAFEAAPMAYASGPARWSTGTPTIPGYVVARAGHDVIRAIGVDAIRAYNGRLTTRIAEFAHERGWRVKTPLDPAKRTGWIGIDLPDAARVQAQLLERHIIVDHRPRCGLRVGPHFYTTDEDLQTLFDALDAIARR
jgi:kynureninase